MDAMQITIHVTGFFEWETVPKDVDCESKEFLRAVKNGKAKPATGGGWLMRVEKKCDTHTSVNVSEDDIIQVIVQEMTRGDRKPMNRKEALARLLSRHVLPHHVHKSKMQEILVENDAGPDEAAFRKVLATHVDAGNLEEQDVEELVAQYMKPSGNDEHVQHLSAHFDMNADKVSKFRAKRLGGAAKAAEGVEP